MEGRLVEIESVVSCFPLSGNRIVSMLLRKASKFDWNRHAPLADTNGVHDKTLECQGMAIVKKNPAGKHSRIFPQGNSEQTQLAKVSS